VLHTALSRWQPLLACLWDGDDAVRDAAAPLLGAIGGAVLLGCAAAPSPTPRGGAPRADRGGGRGGRGRGGRGHPREWEPAPEQQAPPAALLFDWLLPPLSGSVGLPGSGQPATAWPDIQVRAPAH
jgi:hypothetical protein